MRAPAAALLCILSASWLPSAVFGYDMEVISFEGLSGAIKKANTNAEACNKKPKCLGTAVSILIKGDINLQGALPALVPNAHLIITGGCKRQAGRCIIDGVSKYQVFPQSSAGPFPQGNPAKLELYSLIFQKARGGVLVNVYAVVLANKCIFRANTGGVVINVGFYGGAPQQSFISCRFIYNSGRAISSGNGKLGLAEGGGLAIVAKRCIFQKNTGKETDAGDVFSGSGGAVQLAGLGTSVFENTQFIDNSAQHGGGAVFGDQTNIIFRGVSFTSNTALNGPGGAILAQSGPYRNMTAAFCTCAFSKNTAPKNASTDSMVFRPYTFPTPVNRVDATFCDTKIPPGSVFTKEPYGSVTTGTGGKCVKNNCKIAIPY